jgi:hypothetical protein
VELIDQNSVDMHKEPRDIPLQENDEQGMEYSRRQEEAREHAEETNKGKRERERDRRQIN